jgi:hypothetical protein
MVNGADGPDDAIKLCVTKLTRCSLGETGNGTSPQVSKTCLAGNLDGLLLISDNEPRLRPGTMIGRIQLH